MKFEFLYVIISLLLATSTEDSFSSVYWSGSIRWFDTKNFEELNDSYINGAYYPYSVSPNDSLIALVPFQESDKVLIYKCFEKENRYKKVFETNLNGVEVIEFSGDSKYCALPIKNNLYVLDIFIGKVDTIKLSYNIKNWVTSVNDSCFAFRDSDDIIRIFNYYTYEIRSLINIPGNSFQITKDLSKIIYNDFNSITSKNIIDGNKNWSHWSLPSYYSNLKLSPDGNYLAAKKSTGSSYYFNIALFSFPELRLIYEKSVTNLVNKDTEFEFSHDSKYLTFSSDFNPYQYKFLGCKNIRLSDTTISEYIGINHIRIFSWYYSSSGKYLILTNDDSTCFYNLKNETLEKTVISSGFQFNCISDDDKYICFSDNKKPDYTFRFYSLDEMKYIMETKLSEKYFASNNSLSFSLDNKSLNIVNRNKIYRLNIKKGIISDSLSNDFYQIFSYLNDELIIYKSEDGKLSIYNQKTKKRFEYNDQDNLVTNAKILKDKKSILVTFTDNTRVIYSIPDTIDSNSTYELLWRCFCIENELKLSHNDKYLSSKFSGFKIWHVETGDLIFRFDDNALYSSNNCFSKNDSMFYTAIYNSDSLYEYVDICQLDLISGKRKYNHMPGMNPRCSFCKSYFAPSGNYFLRVELIPPDPNNIKEITNFSYNNYIKISPNPASDYIEISYPPLDSGSEGVEIKIYNVFGQIQTTPYSTLALTASREGVRIDVSGLAPGMYFVRIGDSVRKFVKI